MPASQISFSAFALSQCPWCGATGPDFDESPMPSDYCGHDPALVCTPPVLESATAVVTHPLAVDGGECIRFDGAFMPSRCLSHTDYRPDFALVHESFVGCGLDAPEFLPGGSHLSWSPIPTYAKADGYGAFMRGL